MPWVHMDDMLSILNYLINNPDTTGVYNAVAPEILTNKQFTKIFGHILHRPTVIATPKWVLDYILGESAQLLTEGQAVFPKRLQDSGFSFVHSNIQGALQSLYNF